MATIASGEARIELVVSESANREAKRHARHSTGEVRTGLGLVVNEQLGGTAIGEQRDRVESIHVNSILTNGSRCR